MTVAVLPDAEALLVQFLLDQSEVTTFCDTRIYTVLPSKLATWPTVRVTRWGGAPVMDRPLYLDAASLQVDVWGGPKATAHDLAQTIRAAIAERIVGVHSDRDAVVTAANFGPFRFLPDTDFTPAKARYIADVELRLHPL